jgi:hypothetical protein
VFRDQIAPACRSSLGRASPASLRASVSSSSSRVRQHRSLGRPPRRAPERRRSRRATAKLVRRRRSGTRSIPATPTRRAFFHFVRELAATLPGARGARLPSLPLEGKVDLAVFARGFFRGFFALLPPQTVWVIDNFQDAEESTSRRSCARPFSRSRRRRDRHPEPRRSAAGARAAGRERSDPRDSPGGTTLHARRVRRVRALQDRRRPAAARRHSRPFRRLGCRARAHDRAHARVPAAPRSRHSTSPRPRSSTTSPPRSSPSVPPTSSAR